MHVALCCVTPCTPGEARADYSFAGRLRLRFTVIAPALGLTYEIGVQPRRITVQVKRANLRSKAPTCTIEVKYPRLIIMQALQSHQTRGT